MALPQSSDITTEHYDAGTDNPRLARAELKTLATKVRDLISKIDVAGGLLKLDSAGKVPLGDLFITKRGSFDLVFTDGELQHLIYNVHNRPLGREEQPASSRDSISHIRCSREGHIYFNVSPMGARIPRISRETVPYEWATKTAAGLINYLALPAGGAGRQKLMGRPYAINIGILVLSVPERDIYF